MRKIRERTRTWSCGHLTCSKRFSQFKSFFPHYYFSFQDQYLSAINRAEMNRDHRRIWGDSAFRLWYRLFQLLKQNVAMLTPQRYFLKPFSKVRSKGLSSVPGPDVTQTPHRTLVLLINEADGLRKGKKKKRTQAWCKGQQRRCLTRASKRRGDEQSFFTKYHYTGLQPNNAIRTFLRC